MLPLVGWQERGEHFDGGRLARAVRPQEGEDFALGYVEGDVADGSEIAEGLDEMLNL